MEWWFFKRFYHLWLKNDKTFIAVVVTYQSEVRGKKEPVKVKIEPPERKSAARRDPLVDKMTTSTR